MRAPIFLTGLASLVPLLAGCKPDQPQPRPVDASAESLGAPDTKAPDTKAADTKGPDTKASDTKGPEPAPSTEVFAKVFNGGSGCHRTLCIAGPGELDSRPNINLGAMCRRGQGVVKRCEGERCLSVWPAQDWREGLDAMIESFGGPEGRCTIDLAGWSTGAAIVSAELPAALAADPRVGPEQKAVRNVVAMAPYLDKAPKRLELAANISTAFIYRHTKTPKLDCSREWEGGPWRSPRPVCAAATTCYDYDYSLRPLLAYLGRDGDRSGSEVGHCEVASLVGAIGYDNLVHGREAFSEYLPAYSDGSHGGREHPEGPPPPKPGEG